MELVLSVFGDKQISRDLLRLNDRARNLRPVFERLAVDFYRIETEQFDTEGGYGSGGWKPLSAAYLADKIRGGYDPRILHRTNALSKSLTSPSARGAVHKITNDSMELSTKVKNRKGYVYAKAHQNPQRGQTRRRPVEFRSSDRSNWVKAVQRYIITGEVAV